MDNKRATKNDRLACPWVIKNFIDREAEFFFVPANDVLQRGL
ncbi:chromate resistance protein ChrB domain-containing protein [Pontibacter sp. SGAir0037]|nr:chromate resistance protein ChrB domain-containing protein [Pontibacter sp. SGAir0037]